MIRFEDFIDFAAQFLVIARIQLKSTIAVNRYNTEKAGFLALRFFNSGAIVKEQGSRVQYDSESNVGPSVRAD